MKICTGGKVTTKKESEYWFARLYFRDTELEGQRQFSSKYFPTGLLATKKNKAEAESILQRRIKEYSPLGVDTPFSVYCERWLEKKKPTLEQTTYEGYQYKLGHITAYFGKKNVSVAGVTPEMVQDFYCSLLTVKKSAPSQRQDEGLSNRTIKDISMLLRSVIDDAYTLDYIKDARLVEKIKKVKAPRRPECVKKKAYISESTLPLFLNAIKGHCLEDAYKLALNYGLRREEICGLRWCSVRNGKIYIEHTVARMKTTVYKDRTKTFASAREYNLTDSISAMLDRIKEVQSSNRELFGDSYHESDYIFTWEDGRPYSPDYFTRQFKKIVKKTEGLDDSLHLHDLRASCTSMLINAGLSPKAVQNWIGHEDITTTFNWYARSNDNEACKLSDYMDSLIFNAS